MKSKAMRVLLIEDDPEHAELIKTHLAKTHASVVDLDWAMRLTDGLERLATSDIDVTLLDLGLPDSPIDKTLLSVIEKVPDIPIVVLSSLEDEDFAVKAVHQGAQDYISKSRMDGELLFRSMRYSIERKAIEEQLRSANRARDEFLATLSHELRTPVGVIQGFAELLTRPDTSDADCQRGLDAIVRNSKLQMRLIEDLLDMSRIITGKIILQRTTQDLIPIINDALDSVRLAAESKHITLTTSFDPSARLVLGDQIRLHQIMWNLASNAVKFTPMGGKIRVNLRRIKSLVEINVEDNGEGIDPEFLPYVFDRFRQQDSSIRRHAGGLGLGLAIAKYLVDLHGGHIHATSEGRGKGATLTITFPLMAVHIDHQAGSNGVGASGKSDTQCESNQPFEVESQSIRDIKILAVDDDPDLLMLIEITLKRHGAIVRTAKSSAEALVTLDRVGTDVVVCDIGMPGEDGYSLIRKIRTNEIATGKAPTPAVALTAYAREDERREAFRAGFHAHLTKPVREKMLIETIAKLVAQLKGLRAK